MELLLVYLLVSQCFVIVTLSLIKTRAFLIYISISEGLWKNIQRKIEAKMNLFVSKWVIICSSFNSAGLVADMISNMKPKVIYSRNSRNFSDISVNLSFDYCNLQLG